MSRNTGPGGLANLNSDPTTFPAGREERKRLRRQEAVPQSGGEPHSQWGGQPHLGSVAERGSLHSKVGVSENGLAVGRVPP